MAKIKRTAWSQCFVSLHDEAQKLKDNNDCTVKCLALLGQIPYADAHKMLADAGRKPGRGASHGVTEKLIVSLGYKLTKVDIQAIIESYPRPHCDVLKNMTTHHPRRFPGCIDKNKRYLALARGHILAIIDGEVKDWTVNNALRITHLFEVTKV